MNKKNNTLAYLIGISMMTTTAYTNTPSGQSSEIIEIPNLMDIPFLSFDLKDRVVEKMALSNGIQILLISDPNADQSAASVSVGAGSWCDPEEYPGMAHFCEHMLFMGTEKYPDSHEFSTQVANFQGLTNAFTAPNQTVYMFSSHEPGFLPLLDQFAHFFIDPSFDEANLSHELYAVDQEFALQKENDGWRKYFVFKETGNPKHPYASFVTGNSETLSKIPQEALKQWHKKHYTADQMRVAIYSALPMETLKKEASLSFAGVPKGSSGDSPLKFDEPLSSEMQKGHITFIEPFLDRRILELSWELPNSWCVDPSKTADFIAYALNQGREHSLSQRLKKESLIDDLYIGVSSTGNTHPFFVVALALSDLGMEKMEETITYVFQAIEGLKKGEGIPEFLFHEKNTLSKLSYQYQKRVNAFKFISRVGRSILEEDFATYPRDLIIASEYNKDKISEVLSLLKPEQCIITCNAPQKVTKAVYDAKEQWLQASYSIRPIPQDWIASWNEVTENPDIVLPGPNHFIPQNLAILPDPNLGSVPVCIAQSNLGQAYYVRCPEYQTPESVVHLRIFSPTITSSDRGSSLAALYLDHLTDCLEPLLRAAESAQIKVDFSMESHHIHLTLSGFSEKIPLVLQEILTQMANEPPQPGQFEIMRARLAKAYANKAKALPVKQAQELLSTLIHPERATSEDKLLALQSITFEDLSAFHKKLFEKTYCEAIFAGNLLLKTAEASWIDILHSLGTSPYLKAEHPVLQTLHLPEKEGPFLIAKETTSQGNGTILLIDQGDYSLEKRGAQNILAAALQEPFFDTLRTKQKTGYIAQSSHLESEKRLYQFFLVQSNTHQPEDLLHRFELFLESFYSNFSENLSQERFQTIQKSVIETIKTQCRNIKDKADLWESLAFYEKEDFDFKEKRIQALTDLSYERFTEISKEWISRENKKRLAILYAGKIQSPFTYSEITSNELPQLVTYGSAPQEL